MARSTTRGVFVALLAMGCTSATPPAPPANAFGGERARAVELTLPSTRLPSRAEAVAAADAAAIASSKLGKTPEGAELALLAGDLRARIYRLDQTGTDSREALELYSAAAAAQAGTEAGCAADRRRALFAGEIARDAGAAYREIYLAERRQAAAMAQRPSNESSRCLADLDNALAEVIAFRPAGDAMRSLEKEASLSAEALLRGVIAAASQAPAGSAGVGAKESVAAPLPTSSGDVVISPKAESVGNEPVKLVSVEPFGTEQGARVVLNLSGATTFQVGTLAADDSSGKDARIFVDVAKATSKGVKKEIEVGGAVRRVRIGAHTTGTRVVLDLAASLFRRVFYLPDPFRIVIDVSTHAPEQGDKKVEGGKREVGRIVIDPGHGGIDTGAVGPTGLKEKDITLDIAHRVAPLLAHELKIETLLTRDDDTFIPLDLRTARANAFHADLFISIHCNASESGTARGVQTFVLDDAKESAAAKAAAWENTPRGKPTAAIKPRDAGELSLILTNLNVGDLGARSRHVADLLQRSALASLSQRYPDTKDQGIKQAGFFVLVGADMPAVLFETSFISNTDDEARLGTADYRQKLADAIVNAVKAYKAGK